MEKRSKTKKNILMIGSAALAATVGWLITEPWNEAYGFLRSFMIGSVVGLFIVLSILSFNYLYYKKVNLLKKTLRNPSIYIFPIAGDFLSEIVYSSLYGFPLARVFSWAIWGLFLGLAINYYDRNRDKIIVGIVGGFLGGAISAFLFDIIGVFVSSYGGTVARAASFILFAIVLASSLILVESLYKKLSGNSNQFDFKNLKLKNKV